MMRKRLVVRRRRAFTLLEVLMVIVILGLLVTFVVRGLMGQQERAKEDIARTMVKTGLNGAIDRFQLNMGRLPATLEELVTKPSSEEDARKWVGPYLDVANLKDPWLREYRFKGPGEENTSSYDLSSSGKDGEFGTGDDLTNWSTSN
jgi:general secretion pathway protein G